MTKSDSALVKQQNRIALNFMRLTVLLLLCVLFCFAAPLWWGFELFTHFLWHYMIVSAALVMVFILLRKPFLILVATTLFILTFLQAYPFIILKEQDQVLSDFSDMPVKILQFNVAHDNQQKKQLVSWLLSHKDDVDIVVLHEVNEKWMEALKPLTESYFYNYRTNNDGDKNMLVLSQFELYRATTKTFSPHLQSIFLDVILPNSNLFELHAVHAPSPFDLDEAAMRDTILRYVAAQTQRTIPTVMVGDFNATPFSPIFHEMLEKGNLYDSWLAVGYYGTWPAPLPSILALSIDHLLVNQHVNVSDKIIYKNSLGSDHYPVLTSLKFKTP